MDGFIFNAGADGLSSEGSIDWIANTIKIRPVATAAGVPSKDANFMTSIGVTGYDVTVASKSKVRNDTLDQIVYGFASFSFVAVLAGVGEINRAVIFKSVTNDADSIPIAVVDITPTTPNGANINVTVSASGAFASQQ